MNTTIARCMLVAIALLVCATVSVDSVAQDRPSGQLVPIKDRVPPITERNVLLRFSAGSQMQVKLRSFSAIAPPYYLTEPYAEMYPALRKAAEDGDAPAARTLYEMLRWCSLAFPTEAALANAMLRLKQTGEVQLPASRSGRHSRRLENLATDVGAWIRVLREETFDHVPTWRQ